MEGSEIGVVEKAANLVDLYGLGDADGMDRSIRRTPMIGRLFILM